MYSNPKTSISIYILYDTAMKMASDFIRKMVKCYHCSPYLELNR
jgi:hypothetical protein